MTSVSSVDNKNIVICLNTNHSNCTNAFEDISAHANLANPAKKISPRITGIYTEVLSTDYRDYTGFLTQRRKGTRSFLLSTDYTDYTDFPRDPRDPWRHVGAPQGDLLIIYFRRITGISRIFFAHRKHGMHRIAICFTLAPCG